ncbi:hypothetical protein JW968_04665 [Candidatus Woesearchaeota archaeon]|nr:hypothetical protein [Candidatus Woesearchaeota archaeon]
MSFVDTMKGIGVTLLASVFMILLGIVYFMLTVWMVKIGARWAGLGNVAGNTVVMTAGIVTAAAIVGSALRR